MQKTLHFFSNRFAVMAFDVSDVVRIERKLSVITANSQASKSCFLYHTTLQEDNLFSLQFKCS